VKYNRSDSSEVSPELIPLSLCLSPTGHLYLCNDAELSERISTAISEKIHSFFSVGKSVGLLRLGLTNFEETLPASFTFWQQFSKIFVTEICKHADTDEPWSIPQIVFPSEEIKELIAEAPFMRGMEYLNDETARIIWQALQSAVLSELTAFSGNVSEYMSSFHTSWNTIGRVCFHLAENKTNATYPFAFMATYTTGLSNTANTLHLPLGKALETYAGKSKQALLLSLLLPVHRATNKSNFLKALVDTGKIFKPLAWSAHEAHLFLKDIPEFESAGIMIRVPKWWNAHKPPRPSIKITIGEKNVSQLGLDALLDFDVNFSLPTGETLTLPEFKQLLSTSDNLVKIKGQWVQVDNDKLNQVLSHWKSIERKVKKNGLSFAEGLRLVSGVAHLHSDDALPEEITAWSTVIEGDWLQSTLSRLRNPIETDEFNTHAILMKSLNATLRPYQERGVQWLWWLYNIGLGGCLADDMGLGKTIQVICLLLLVKSIFKRRPHLLILPASLVGNWQVELSRFAPSLSLWVAHNSAKRVNISPDLSDVDLVITTYGTLSRSPWLNETNWNKVILDEAQAIKNPATKQTRIVKLLKSRVRFVLTGTPIENRLLDLWSLFDFAAPGLLGSSRDFADYNKKTSKNAMGDHKGPFYAAVRRLTSPYVLRRLKSDKQIIGDLPDKTEMQTYCTLTKPQISLYQQAVDELTHKLVNQGDNINRRGLVMSYLLRLKQICNHPTQWLGHGQYGHELSGKFIRLKELCAIIAEKQEKVLVFTQFKEIIPALCEVLQQVFKKEGLFLHGQTTIKDRSKRVDEFQQDQGPPFFVLSLKAGGTGINLTAASHVIHFDRWWNPAVENQATDRAYRIGQQKNVLVHKFICRGTIEEKIDSLLNAKKALSNEIMAQDKEIALTELSDTELLNIVTLDIHRALGEA